MSAANANPIVGTLLHQLDMAFEGEHWHSLMRNLASTAAEDWDWAPPGGKRTIRDIVCHVGACKLMLENKLVGDRRLTWEDPYVSGQAQAMGGIDAALAWLREANATFRAGVARLADADLPVLRQGYWDEPRETRWSVEVIIQHDLYHAGEINLIRALHQGNDA
jgi:hypothetical protein